MSSALRPIYSRRNISECIFNKRPLVREGDVRDLFIRSRHRSDPRRPTEDVDGQVSSQVDECGREESVREGRMRVRMRMRAGKEEWEGGFFFSLFNVSKGAAFPKVPGATLQHLGSPRPFGCLLIANPHLCHMAR